MRVINSHEFHTEDTSRLREIQMQLKQQIVLTNSFCKKTLQYIAGVDLAYWKEEEEYGTCCIVVINYNTKEVVEKVSSVGRIQVPYMPGFLAFRELPLVIEAAKKLTITPDLFMFDGNGYLHPEHMGIATQASFFLNRPTIGVAKSYFKIGEQMFEMPQKKQGAYTEIIVDGEVYGRVLRTREGIKPIFISCGNYIDLQTATDMVFKFITKESRLPIPVRLADIETHLKRKEIQEHQ